MKFYKTVLKIMICSLKILLKFFFKFEIVQQFVQTDFQKMKYSIIWIKKIKIMMNFHKNVFFSIFDIFTTLAKTGLLFSAPISLAT